MISVVVTVYNDIRYIENCLKSILNQNGCDIEVLVVDDGSTDGGEKFINRFVDIDKRVSLIKQENKGLSSARNTGMCYAKGEYITFVDGDDELLPGALHNLLVTIKQTNADAAVGSIDVVHESHIEQKEHDDWYYTVKYEGALPISDQIIANFHCSACAVLFKRDIINANSLAFPVGLLYEDAFWHWAYFSSCTKVAFLKCPVYRYFRRSQSIMATTFDRKKGVAIQHLFVIEKIFEYWEDKGMLATRYNTVIKLLSDYFWIAFRYSPDFERPRVVYECARIIRRFSLPVESGGQLDDIAQGRVAFLFPPDEILQKNIARFSKFVQIQEALNKAFPIGSIRRRLVVRFARHVWRWFSLIAR